MKALVYSEVKQLTMQERPMPEPRSDEVLLRVWGTGICGSDMAGFLGHSPRRKPPLILGHEALGVVERMPKDPPRWGDEWAFQVGQRVIVNPVMPCWKCAACRVGKNNICANWKVLGMDRVEGAFADFVSVAAANVFPIPDSLPDERAIMIEPLANGIHLFNLIERHQFGSVAIIGAGTQGCLMLALARMLGYRDIAMVDISKGRLEVARTLGAKHLINAAGTDTVAGLRDCFPGGADIVIDAHGNQKAREACVGAVKKGGEVLLLGLHEVQSSLDFTAIVRNEIRLQGSFAYTPQDFAQSQKLIENGDIDFTAWTVTRPLEEGQAAFDLLTTDPGSTMKIILKS